MFMQAVIELKHSQATPLKGSVLVSLVWLFCPIYCNSRLFELTAKCNFGVS